MTAAEQRQRWRDLLIAGKAGPNAPRLVVGNSLGCPTASTSAVSAYADDDVVRVCKTKRPAPSKPWVLRTLWKSKSERK